MEGERQLIITALETKEARAYFDMKGKRMAKCDWFSTMNRAEGDGYYETLDHDASGHAHTLNAYSLAISMAPTNSEELAEAFYSRAVYFQHLNKNEEALNDTERALAITKSNFLKLKLFCTQTHCYCQLDRPEQKALFEKVKFMFKKFRGSKKEKKELQNSIDMLAKIVKNGDPDYARKARKKKGIDVDEILSKKETEDPFESVTIKENTEHGRHLVAARDIKAGEIISVLKPYTINSNTELQPYLFCCHCMKIRWDSMPCKICGWCFFCSEECREEAWQQYHDIECAVVPMIRHTAEDQHLRQLTVRTVIKAVREAGGIAELRKELQEVDKKLKDIKTKGFSEDEKFENDKFVSVYTLMSKKSSSLSRVHLGDAVRILIIFAKSTKLFGSANKFKAISQLLADDDAVFIGSLILKLFGIFDVNYQEVWEKNPCCQQDYNKKLCFKERCCYRTSMISPLFSLINHSCNPNAALFYTDAKKLMLVALKPINKGVQIYQTYSGCGHYIEEEKTDRQWICKNAYNFTCECEACLKNWPLLKNLKQIQEKLLPNVDESYKLEGEKLKKVKDILTSIEKNKIQYNESTLEELANAIELATRNYAEPSFTISTLVWALSKGYRKLYLKRLRFPNNCNRR